MFGTALITLLFLDVVWLGNVRSELDDQLEKTAENIKDEFKGKLDETIKQLVKYDRSDDFRDDFTCVSQGKNCPISDLNRPDFCAEKGNRKCGGKTKWVARKNFPYQCDNGNCDLFFWIDQHGRMRITWNTDSEYYLQSSDVSLAHRDYVKRILEPESSLWHTEYGQPAFYAQSLISLGTDTHTVVVSMESSQNEPPESPRGRRQKWVAAIETHFNFLKSVAIPDGTGFAVIEDKGGRVLFHSDDKRSLWENLFEETDNNAQLKAHAFSRTAGQFEGRYWGKGHSFYSTPLPSVPWSLVVFRNKELFRTTNFEALLLAGTLFALYTIFSTIVVLVVIGLFTKARRRKMSMMSWFWPDPDRHDWYYAYIGFIFLLFLGYILWLWFTYTPGEYAVWFPLLYPLVSLIGLWSLPKDCPPCTQEILPQTNLHRRYAFAVISFLLLFSALPMGLCFKTGADREMILAMKYNLITLGHKLRQLSDLDFSQIQIKIPEINDKSRTTDECQENVSSENPALLQHSIHLSVITKTGLCLSDDDSTRHEKPSPLDKIHRRIRDNSLSRLANPVSIETLGLLGNQSPGKPFDWIVSPSSTISLKLQAHSKSGTKWVVLRSLLPPDIWWSIAGFPTRGHLGGSIVLIVFVPVLVLVPIFIVSRIFPMLRTSPVDENSYRETGNFLIVSLPKALQYYSPKSHAKRIDCLQIGELLQWWNIKRQVPSIQEDLVILEHFEYQFGVPQFDHAKLELLNALLVGGKQIRVLSAINPFAFDREDEPRSSSPDESKHPAPVSLQEWSQVFQSFTLRYYRQDRQNKPDREDQLAMPADSRSALAIKPYYAAIWQARTLDEKITLHHLARDGFVHAENQDLRYLVDLGLITFNPNPRLLNDDFEKYVLDAAQRDRLDAIERVKRRSRWQVLKWPLAIVFVVLVIGLLLTQQEFHNAVVLVLSLLPVLLPTFSELIEGPQKDDNTA